MILLPIPFPNYSQHYHISNTSHVLFYHTLRIPSIFQFSLSTGWLIRKSHSPKPAQSSGAGPPSEATLCSLNVRYQPSRRSSAIYVHKIVPLLTLPREMFPSSLTPLLLSHRKSRPSIPSLITISLLSIADSERWRESSHSCTDISSLQVMLENVRLIMKLPTHWDRLFSPPRFGEFHDSHLPSICSQTLDSKDFVCFNRHSLERTAPWS